MTEKCHEKVEWLAQKMACLEIVWLRYQAPSLVASTTASRTGLGIVQKDRKMNLAQVATVVPEKYRKIHAAVVERVAANHLLIVGENWTVKEKMATLQE